VAHEARSPPDAPRRAGIEAGAGTEEEGDQMTATGLCAVVTAAASSSPTCALYWWSIATPVNVVHVAGLSRCGIVVDVLERGEVTP